MRKNAEEGQEQFERVSTPISLELNKNVPVVVPKVGDYTVYHGALGIVRSLGKVGVPVYVVVEDRLSPIATSRYLAGAFVRDIHSLDAGRFVEDLAAIGERLGCPAILAPIDDTAAVFIGEHAAVLEKWYVLPPMPKDLPRRLTNKKQLYSLCKSTGVPCPEVVFPRSADDVREFIERATFPVVVKAAESQRLPKAARSTSIARTPSELLTLYLNAESPESPNLIFQEYIPRFCAEDWIVHGYYNPRTDCFVAFTGKKLRSFPPFAGITTLGVSAVNERLRRQTEKLLRATGYAGIMDLDYRLDHRDGEYKLLDFNPRIGANFRMFEDQAGIDVVRALHLDLTGRSVLQLPAEDRTFIVEFHDLFASVRYVQCGGLTVGAWSQTLKGPREFAWFSLVDPMPSMVMCVRLMLRTVLRAAQRSWIWLTRRGICTTLMRAVRNQRIPNTKIRGAGRPSADAERQHS
jgi:predicted ATP-grasp superfamily ATP-dependent carboligase